METPKKIKDFCQDEINEFSVLGYEPSKYQLGYNSAINYIKEIYEEIPDNYHQIEKLEADKAELLEALEKCNKFLYDFKQKSIDDAYKLQSETISLIQKHKQ